MIRPFLPALLIATSPALALDLDVPSGALTREEISPSASIRLPSAPWSESNQPLSQEGALRQRAFRLGGSAQTTLQLLMPLRDALEAAGYAAVYTCEASACGGFDFRFQLDLLGEPEMHVDLGDFRYFLAENETPPAGDPKAVSIVTSRAEDAGFVHISEVFETTPPPTNSTPQLATTPDGSLDIASTLETQGHSVLADLDFGSGEATLGSGTYESLAALADWLAANPGISIAIVGHTDAIGNLAANTALSKRRAESVLARLRDTYGASPSQMEADGAGYLAPIASNLTADGRAANRRVEVIVLSDGS